MREIEEQKTSMQAVAERGAGATSNNNSVSDQLQKARRVLTLSPPWPFPAA